MYTKGLWGYLPANILAGLVGFATLIAFTRVLSPADYGCYALTLGVTSLAQTVFFTWLEAAMARFYPQDARSDIEAPQLYGTVYRLFAGVVILFAAVCVLGLWLWPATDTSAHTLKTALSLGLASVVFRSLAKLVTEQRRSEGRVASASMFDMIQTAGGFVIGLLCVWLGLGGASPIVGAGLIALICLPVFAREDWGRAARGQFSAEKARLYAAYGFPISASLILTLALYTADRFLIAHYLNEAEAGAYHAGFSLASRILDVLFIWFGAAGTPAMIHALENGGEAALKETSRQQIKTMAFVLFPAVGGLIMVAPALGNLMIGEALRADALSVTPLISLGALFSGLNSYYFLQAFTLAKKTRLLVVAMAVPAISNIALNIALIPVMGLMGAALASCISFGLGLLASWLLGLKTLPLPIAAPDLLKILGCVGVMMAAIALLPSFGASLVGSVAELVLKGAIGVLIYAGLALGLDLNHVRAPAFKVFQRIAGKVFA